MTRVDFCEIDARLGYRVCYRNTDASRPCAKVEDGNSPVSLFNFSDCELRPVLRLRSGYERPGIQKNSGVQKGDVSDEIGKRLALEEPLAVIKKSRRFHSAVFLSEKPCAFFLFGICLHVYIFWYPRALCYTICDMEHIEYVRTVARSLLVKGKGILAADESTKTMDTRLAAVGAMATPDMRREYRELLFTAPGIEEYLSGVILYDETIRSGTADDGVPFADLLIARGIIPGIKVDRGTVPLDGFPDEVVTEGLDGLAARMSEYYGMGARFTKWRAVITIGENLPTDQCIRMNAAMLARFASLSQGAGMVPIVEPEVMLHGDHDIARAQDVTTKTLETLFETLTEYRVDLAGLILKSSMVLAGDGSKTQSTPEEVADATLRTFAAAVPKEVPGVVLLSGGQTPRRATENLQAMAHHGAQPWQITFSYSRALEEPVLTAWRGDTAANKDAAQAALLHRLMLNAKAQTGDYEPALEDG